MQDTPNYEPLRNRFSQYNLSDYLDNPVQPIPSPYREVIADSHAKLSAYFTEDDFRRTLSTVRRNNIESQISNIIAQYDQIIALRNQNPPSLIQNIEGISTNIQSYVEEIDLRFYSPYQTFLLQGRSDLVEVVSSIRNSEKEASLSKEKAKEALGEADLLVGEGSDIDIANYYQKLANGKTFKENEQFGVDEPRSKKALLAILTLSGVLLLILALVVPGTVEVGKIFGNHYLQILLLLISFLLFFSIPIYLILKYFNKKKPGGYDRSAAIWFLGVIGSVALTGIYAIFLLHQIGGSPTWGQLIPKIVSLLAPAYLVRFCVQNYRASKHLYVVNTHRAVVARVASAFAKSIPDDQESLRKDSLALRSAVIHKASDILFAQTESGYLTVKEGAGNSGDSPLDSLNIITK